MRLHNISAGSEAFWFLYYWLSASLALIPLVVRSSTRVRQLHASCLLLTCSCAVHASMHLSCKASAMVAVNASLRAQEQNIACIARTLSFASGSLSCDLKCRYTPNQPTEFCPGDGIPQYIFAKLTLSPSQMATPLGVVKVSA